MRALAVLLVSALCTSAALSQTFPCPASSAEDNTPLAGGYQFLDVTDDNIVDLFSLANISFIDWFFNDDNITICNGSNIVSYDIVLGPVCTQVVAGTNTALQYLVTADCQVNEDTAVADRLLLDAIVFTPLPTAGNTEPQVTSVFVDPSFTQEALIVTDDPSLFAPVPAPAPTAGLAAVPSATFTPTSPLRTFPDLGSRRL